MSGDDRDRARTRNQDLWAVVSADLGDADAAAKWGEPAANWGLFGRPEAELQVLGDLAGVDVLELGCGAAYFSGWLRRAGATPVALDLSEEQLHLARRHQVAAGVAFPVVRADSEQVPLRAASFDLVVSEYGAAPWCHPARWLAEAARVLRPGGRLVFLTNSVLAALCVPAEGGPAGTELLRPQGSLSPIAWPGGGVEHHIGHGDWIRELRGAGFVVDALHELHAPPGSVAREYYDIVTEDWARRWPAEDLWVAHLEP